jgi:hypothetical protein
MSPRLLRPRATGTAAPLPTDADARAYVLAVNAADGQPLEANVVNAIDDFVSGCKTDGIWSAIKASCILMGARTLSGALTPLVGSAPANVGFLQTDYNRKTGLVGNGSSKHLDSNRPSNADPQDSHHIALYQSQRILTGTPSLMGAGTYSTNGVTQFTQPFSGDPYIFAQSRSAANSYLDGPAGNAVGFLGIVRSASSGFSFRSPAGTTTTTSRSSVSPLSDNTFIFATSSGTSASNRYAGRIAFYSIGESLSLAALGTRVTKLFGSIASLDGPRVANAEAQDWINRVYINGGTVSQTTADAVNTFCNSIDSAGIRSRLYRVNLFAGDNLASAFTPLYNSTSFGGTVIGNASDTNTGPFVAANYVETGANGGLNKPDGATTKQVTTGLTLNNLPSLSSVSFATSFGANSITAGWGMYGIQPGFFLYVADDATGYRAWNVALLQTSGELSRAVSGSARIGGRRHIGSRTASNAAAIYENGVSVVTDTSSVTALSASATAISVMPTTGGGGLARIRYYAFGLGLNATQAAALDAAFSAYLTAMGRV